MTPSKPPKPAAAALDWIRRALIDELPDDELETLHDRADSLHAICTRYGVKVELLIDWIHGEGSRWYWSALEWRRWCQRHIEEQIDAARVAIVPENWPE